MLTLKASSLRKKALLLVWIGEIWNIFEAIVALWAALLASSVALLAFGLDSLIELFAGAVLIWRFWKEASDESSAEKKALRLVGATFFLLSGFILFQSTTTLLGYFSRPQESFIGILLTISSAVLMTILFVFKKNIAYQLGSRALRAEAYESLVCDIQDLIVLVGLGLNILLGWWWADPLMAIALIPFLIKEGIETFRDEQNYLPQQQVQDFKSLKRIQLIIQSRKKLITVGAKSKRLALWDSIKPSLYDFGIARIENNATDVVFQIRE